MANTRWSYGSFRILCKQFWWWPSELSQIAWHLHDQQLTLGQSVLLPMQTWKWYTFKMLQMSTMFVSHPIKIKAMQFCSSLFDKLWRDGVPLTRSLFFASCHQLNIKSLGGNHNLCHICRGYILERESFYRVKSWMIETPFPETYCENPGAELWNAVSASFASVHVHRHGPENSEAVPHGRRGEPGTWSAIGLKQFSYQPDGDELRVLPAGKSTGQHLWVKQKMPIHGTCDGNRMGRTPWTELLKPIMNYGMTIGPSYSTLVLAKWSIAKCSTGSWPWVSLSYFQCKDESDLFWRCLEYRAHACHVTESQRWTSVTAVQQTLAWCQVVSQPFLILMSAARMRSPLFGMLAELAPHVGVEAESNIAQSFEDSRSITAVKTLQHCCIKLDIQKGGSSEGSPTIVKNS